ncbi:hypothetical protein F4805DRAFT_87342 [Annulohypoxylon moriforme]|nr:hypothetical protein F4805DRAFT_87342 [Annulohypoxylon moriforme]
MGHSCRMSQVAGKEANNKNIKKNITILRCVNILSLPIQTNLPVPSLSARAAARPSSERHPTACSIRKEELLACLPLGCGNKKRPHREERASESEEREICNLPYKLIRRARVSFTLQNMTYLFFSYLPYLCFLLFSYAFAMRSTHSTRNFVLTQRMALDGRKGGSGRYGRPMYKPAFAAAGRVVSAFFLLSLLSFFLSLVYARLEKERTTARGRADAETQTRDASRRTQMQMQTQRHR